LIRHEPEINQRFEVVMRGADQRNDTLFSYVRPDSRIPPSHPLRPIRRITNAALTSLSDRFDALYSEIGRPSIPPEKLLRALLLQAFYSIRSERQLMEQLDYNLLFRWFVGLSVDEPVWDPTVFTKNRQRMLDGEIAAAFMDAVLNQNEVKVLLSAEHFSVDGTLIQAWASMKSFRRKDGKDQPPSPGRNGTRDFHEEKRSNETHASTTDPNAKLYRKGDGQESRLCYMGHVMMENRHGLAVAGDATEAAGTAERVAALDLIDAHRPSAGRITVGADKGFDVEGFVHALRERQVTPHIAIDGHLTKTGKRRKTAIDERTLRHAGYDISQRCRKRIEEVFGWIKTTGGIAQVKVRGLAKVRAVFTFAILAYNLVRIPKLLAIAP
jgi:transposase